MADKVGAAALQSLNRPPEKPRGPVQTMGQQEFLKLLTAQLKNQDPLNVQAPHEFAAQLAQFTSVEQLVGVNRALAAQATSQGGAEAASKAGMAAGLVGKRVLGESDALAIDAQGQGSIYAEIAGTGGKASITLFDMTGRTVQTRDLGQVGSGRVRLDLGAVPASAARYQLSVTTPAGSAVQVLPLAEGTVTSVRMEQGGPVLMVGNRPLSLDKLIEIAGAPPAGN